MKEIFLNTYGRKYSWIVIAFALWQIVGSFVTGGWWGLIAIAAWVFFVPSVIWLIDNK